MSSLKETMLANLREMVKLQRAAHDSMFKFSIKKMWPISLIAPQVDWIRIARMMDTLQDTCKKQKKFLSKEKGSAPEADLPFLNSLPEYLDSLAKVAEFLGRAAVFKQDVLEKKIKASVKEWNAILKSYNEASDKMAKVGISIFFLYDMPKLQSGQ
jgi:hypothetical protein